MNQVDGLKQWQCSKGHVLGVVERASFTTRSGHSGHVSRLMLYRHAIDLDQQNPTEVEVIGALEGTMLHIRCDVPGCGEIRTWEIGADALERLKTALGGGEK
jgi:hypothetical protein